MPYAQATGVKRLSDGGPADRGEPRRWRRFRKSLVGAASFVKPTALDIVLEPINARNVPGTPQ